MSKKDESILTEKQETITFVEFQAWLAGLIRGKRGGLPDFNDWRKIKMMLDKVEPEKEYITLPAPNPQPTAEPYVPQPWTPPALWEPYVNPKIWMNDNTRSPPPMFDDTIHPQTKRT